MARWFGCVLFTAAALTDWLDGHVARRWSQQSELGRFLDPIADKLLVAATLFMLTAFGRLPAGALLPALVILCREILVSGLREYLAELRVGLPVSRLAKWKTAIQMTAIGFLIVGEAGPALVAGGADRRGAAMGRRAAYAGHRLRLPARRCFSYEPDSDEPRARAAARQTAAPDVAALSRSGQTRTRRTLAAGCGSPK